jgi:oligoribonuclease NrnB/cAMP/cGMP phosphodiesterase (DHH superfamily)
MDGFTAAWACWLKHPDWEFVPGVHGTVIPTEKFEDRDVYFLDFSYKRPVMEAIIKVAKSVFVIDHHVTAKEELSPLFENGSVTGLFNMSRSGAHLAWKWFHDGEEIPQLILFVEDRDLWKFQYTETRPVCDAIFSHDYSFETWNQLRKQCDGYDNWSVLVNEGLAIGRKQAKDLKELLAQIKYKGFIDGLCVPMANLPYQYSSDAGHEMAKDAPFAATYYFDGDYYKFSLRSSENGLDVSKVAAKFGGGGHAHAAGFQVSRLEDLR